MIPVSVEWPYEVTIGDRVAILGLASAHLRSCEDRMRVLGPERLKVAMDVVTNETPENIVRAALGFASLAMRVESITGKALKSAEEAGIDGDSPELAAVALAHETIGKLLGGCGEQMMEALDPTQGLVTALGIIAENDMESIEDVSWIIGVTFFDHLLEMF